MGMIIVPLKGMLYGAISGGLVGCVLAWSSVARSFTRLGTFWPDCGPHIFVPLWLGAVVGLVSRLGRESFSWLMVVIVSGVCAGLLVPAAFEYSFGRAFNIGTGFMGISYAQEIVLGSGGVIAAVFWYFGINKLFR